MTPGEMSTIGVLFVVYTFAILIIGMLLGSILTIARIVREAKEQEKRTLESMGKIYPANPPDDTDQRKYLQEQRETLDPRDEGWLRRMLDFKHKKDNNGEKK